MPSASHTNVLPLHDIEQQREAISILDIGYKNPYDFTQKHRHSYFELLFFEKGGGTQLIDFHEYVVQDHSCYIVCPKQIHLLDRASDSTGTLIQFMDVSYSDSDLNMRLNDRLWRGEGGVLFENSPELMEEFSQYLQLLRTQSKSERTYRSDTKRNVLQAMLFDLLSVSQNMLIQHKNESELYAFLKLIDAHHKEAHSVGFYIEKMVITEKKLGSLTKQHLGLSPLQVIHDRLIIEAKRLLVFADVQQKEIAFDLGFDSPARFSAFVKSKTGMTPSHLREHVAEIHKA